jgi:hypothetical protein
MKTNPYLFWAKITAIVFIILVIVTGLFLKPYIIYEGALNGTNWIYGDTHALKFETVPTVINGITAVTSIIIGFSGAIVGLVYREDFKKDKKVKVALLTLAFYSAVPLTLLLIVYDSLIYGALEFALKWALYALILALADFIIAMLSIFYRLGTQKDTELGNKENQPSMPESATKEPTQRDSEEEHTKSQTTEKEVLKLVQWIDEHEKQVIKPSDIFHHWKTSLFLLIVVVFGVAELMNFITATNTERISIGLASVAVFIAFISIIIQTGETNLIEGHLKNAKKLRKFNDREMLLLKALIKIKSKNEESKLMTIYEMDKGVHGDIFTEKKLLELICK